MRLFPGDLIIVLLVSWSRADDAAVAVDRIVAEGAKPPLARCQERCGGDWSLQLPKFLFLVDEDALSEEAMWRLFNITNDILLTKAELKARLAGWADSLKNEMKKEGDRDGTSLTTKELYKHWAAALKYEKGARLRQFAAQLASEKNDTLNELFAKITSIKLDDSITFDEECRRIRGLLNATDDVTCFHLTSAKFAHLSEAEGRRNETPPFFTENVDDAERRAFAALTANGAANASKADVRRAQLEWAAGQSPEVLPTLIVFQRAVAVSKRFHLAHIRRILEKRVALENQSREAVDALDLFHKIARIEEDDSISAQDECRLIRQLVRDADPADPLRVIMGLPRRGEEANADAACELL